MRGVSFEKAVAALQARLDPAAAITHNEYLVDRHGHRRQFDVVMRGTFCGQPLLGVIECKDLKRKLGTPEVDAFTTKASDVNASLKLLVSRRGFSKQALEKAKHLGIQCLSLVQKDPANLDLRVGGYWYGFLRRWERLEVTLLLAEGSPPLGIYDPFKLKIQGKTMIDWYTNQLIDMISTVRDPGWTEVVAVRFMQPQHVEWDTGQFCLCDGVDFRAELSVDEREYFVGLRGDGFFDWQQSKFQFAGNQTLVSEAVPTDLRLWPKRNGLEQREETTLKANLFAFANPFDYVPDAVMLDTL